MLILVHLLVLSGFGMVAAARGHTQNVVHHSPESEVYAAALGAVDRSDPNRVTFVSGCAYAWGDYGGRG